MYIVQYTPNYSEIHRNTRKYPGIPRNTQEYPEIPKIPKNNRSYISTLLPNPKPRIFSNTRPDPILKNPTRWAPSMIRCRIEVVSLLLLVLLCLKSMLEISSGYICDCNLWPATFPSHISPPSDCLTWLEVSWLRQFPSSCSFVALRYNDDAKSQIFS